MTKNNPEYQAGAAIVDEGISFKTEKVFGIPITLTIRPSRPGTIVRISQKISLMDPIEEATIQEFLQKGKNLETIAGIIATAIVNKEFFKMWKYRWYKWLLLNRIPDASHLYSYFLIVQKQTDPQFFFLIMGLTPAMNYLRKKETTAGNSGAEKPSGDQSDSSKKHSGSATGK